MSQNSSESINEIDQTIQRELDEIKKSDAGARLLSPEELETLATETRLFILLEAAAHFVFVAPVGVFNALKKEFYGEFDGRRGGLNFTAYNKYARGSRLVAEAAQRHRDFVTDKAKR
jgi:hypothetical protein